ncbi:hypothetical protein [Chryseobacterium lactis]|uniref:hypothetical protein n=1 Tax=Chryseobacterium lactis TaxID=1241981 RepID=UPI001626F5D1|nr:hypothetical protein [Chryseobacterium lactis]
MELDFRKLLVTKLFGFSKEDEKLICEVYDQLFELYAISVIDIPDSPYKEFSSGSDQVNLLKTPKICYYITNKDKTNTFYLFIMNIVGTSIRGARMTDKEDTLEIWGLKKLDDNYGYISINKKNLADKIAGIFSSFNINYKENKDFKDFYVLGSDPYKTMTFLNAHRKEIIKTIPDADFKIEIKNDLLSFGLPKKLSVDNAFIIADFLENI